MICLILSLTASEARSSPSVREMPELKYFFNSGISRTDGDDLASEAVKLKIKQIIGSESPKNPHSDQRIVELLKDQNIEIARRTVAKYREQLRILSSSKRRQVF